MTSHVAEEVHLGSFPRLREHVGEPQVDVAVNAEHPCEAYVVEGPDPVHVEAAEVVDEKGGRHRTN